jgi:hypothetical protein
MQHLFGAIAQQCMLTPPRHLSPVLVGSGVSGFFLENYFDKTYEIKTLLF